MSIAAGARIVSIKTAEVYVWADGVYSGLRAEQGKLVRAGGDRRECAG